MKLSLVISIIAHAMLFGIAYEVISKQSSQRNNESVGPSGHVSASILQPIEVTVKKSDSPSKMTIAPTDRAHTRLKGEPLSKQEYSQKAPRSASETSSSASSSSLPQSSGSQISGADSSTSEKARYLSELRIALLEKVEYPRISQLRRQTGTVRVRFKLNREGEISEIELAESSHSESLDTSALDAVRKLGHFKPIPPENLPQAVADSHDFWTVVIPIDFKFSD